MAEIQKIEIDKEFVVKLKGKVDTNLTYEQASKILDNLHEHLREIISESVGEDIVFVAPVKHGEWQDYNGIFRCSECGYSFEHEGYKHFFHFCPNCGAEMSNT